MPLLGGFRVGRVFGFEIRIDYSWFLVLALVVWTFGEEFSRRLPGHGAALYYTMSISAGLVFFLSVLLHELAHSAVARSRGIQVEGITLFIFGGVAQTRMEAQRAADEFLLTAAGPLTSLALAAAFYAIAAVVRALGWPEPVATVAGFLALLNLVLAIFNMVPGFPLDGGRIFRSTVWYLTGDLERATRWATLGGKIFGWALVAFGALQLLHGFLLSGLWSAFIGWFLASAASASWRQFAVRRTLSRVPVGRVMRQDPVAVSPDLSVRDLVEDYLLRRPDGSYPVVSDGSVLGLVGVGEVSSVPADRRAATRVWEVMRPVSEVTVVDPSETLDRIVSQLGPGDDDRALVVRNGRLVGVLALEDVGQWVRRARELGLA